MRAMILAAGLGTRMHPLTTLRAKPALPVLGRPVIAWELALLAHHGIRDVVVNLHHLPETVIDAVERFSPPNVTVHYSREEVPLGTGGGISRARDFLSESDPSIVLAGDMLLDVDLTALIEEHRQSRADCTLVLRRDDRAEQFGTIGVDPSGSVRRIARRFDLGGEKDAGVFLGVRLISPALFASLPEIPDGGPFEDLSDWLAPSIRAGQHRVRGRILEPEEAVWEPVGTPAEYLAANLAPPALSYLPPPENLAKGTKLVGRSADVVLGAGASLGRGAALERCVIWDHQIVPDGARARGGVIAGGRFYACEALGEGSGFEE